MTTEVLNEVEPAALDQASEGITDSRVLNRFLPLITLVILWAICHMMLQDGGYGYVAGFLDGAFAMMGVRAVAMVAREYRGESAQEIAEARKAVLTGLIISAGVLVAAAGAVCYLLYR